MLKSIFVDKLIEDDRVPMATLQLPLFLLDHKDTIFGIYAPKSMFWMQLAMVLILQIFIQIVFAVIVYKCIVKQRDNNRGTSAQLIGYSVIIPLSIYIPFFLMDYLDVHNKTLKLGFMTVPTVVVFRTMEAMYGTSPHTVESSVGTYVIYYTSLGHFEWDPEKKTRRRMSSKELLSKFLEKIVVQLILTSLLLSFCMHFDYKPFESKVEITEYHFNWDLVSPGHLGNAYILALLTNLVLAFGFELAAFADNVKGYYTKPIFLNPIFTSRSPTEFWGRKWNLLIHRTLKHAVFMPSRQLFPEAVAVTLTFLASGLLHEMSWMVMFYEHGSFHGRVQEECQSCFPFIFFKVSAFFLWNAGVMVLEKRFGQYFAFTKSWPTVLVSTLVLLTALPVSHWFTGDWAAGGYYSDFAIGLFHIRKIQ